MDRYKEGYNDCNIEWEKKIQEKINELEKENIKMETNIEQTVILSVKWSTNKAIIEALQDLLKKG